MRALAAHDYDPTVRNPDWLAEQFLGPAERRILAEESMIKALDMDYREGSRIESGVVGVVLVRTRYIDEALKRAVRGKATQVVILGAGFDSRAYRMRDLLKNATIFEVDYGPTQEYKKRRVVEVLGSLPSNVVYTPIDFSRETLSDVLAKSGYSKDKVTLFIWEGVVHYIPEQAVRETLRFVSQSAPDSTIVFDAKRKSFIEWVKANIDNPGRAPASGRDDLAQQRKIADWKEPQIFGIPDGQEKEFLHSTGLELVDLLPQNGPEARRRYLTRRDGSIAFPIPPPNPAVPSFAGYMVEAAVRRR